MSSTSTAIAVEELRIGMFVQLDGGWFSHPFAVSDFKLDSAEQIDRLRSLGLRRVRWVPEKSDLAAPANAGWVAAPAEPDPPAEPSEAGAPQELTPQQALQAQRETAQRCERQHNETVQAVATLMTQAAKLPAQGAQAGDNLSQACTAMTRQMVEQLLAGAEVGIRLVGPNAHREASHAVNVSVVSLLVGRSMAMSETELQDLAAAALLHDIGKQQLPTQHRHLDSGQSQAELRTYQTHVGLGLRQTLQLGLSAGALQILSQHHEHADGTGFPRGLAGEQILLGARVVAIANRFDNLVNPRNSAAPLSPHEALAGLFSQHRQCFDSSVLNVFIRLMGVYPAGSLVQLTDDRYALVVGANSSRPLKPRVVVHDAAVPRPQALLLDLEQQRDLGIRRSVLPRRVPAEVLQYLDPRPRVAYFFEPFDEDALGGGAA